MAAVQHVELGPADAAVHFLRALERNERVLGTGDNTHRDIDLLEKILRRNAHRHATQHRGGALRIGLSDDGRGALDQIGALAINLRREVARDERFDDRVDAFGLGAVGQR